MAWLSFNTLDWNGMEYIDLFIEQFLYFYNEMAIYLLFGFFVAGVLHIFFPDSFINRHLGQNTMGSVFKSTLAGIPLPLCSCGVIPVAASIRRKGASKGATLSFLIATPQIGSDSFLITYSLIGWIFALFRIAAAFFTAILSGILANIFARDSEGDKAIINANDKNSGPAERMRHFFPYLQNEVFGPIVNYLVAGLVLAGLIGALIPDGFFEAYLNNPFMSMIVMLLVGIPMYICATASTPIAASLLIKGISPGAALVFLLAGPATNAVTITTVLKTMGKRALSIYLGSIIIISLILGYILNVLAFDFHLTIMNHHRHEILPNWLKLIGSFGLLIMFGFHYIKSIYHKFSAKGELPIVADLKTLAVKGMTCMHCQETVRKAVDSAEGVKNVNVNLSSGLVSFSFSADNLDRIKEIIRDKGYEVE